MQPGPRAPQGPWIRGRLCGIRILMLMSSSQTQGDERVVNWLSESSWLLVCRYRFADIQYQHAMEDGGLEQPEHSINFLVDASTLARPNEAAAAAISTAEVAPAREAAAKRAWSQAELAAKTAAEVQWWPTLRLWPARISCQSATEIARTWSWQANCSQVQCDRSTWTVSCRL